jgi:serine kinase of HPr protein (carbohydrate metabolism regulator)
MTDDREPGNRMTAASSKAIAKELLQLEKKIAPDLLRIDGLKEKLRELCTKTGAGFTEEIEGLGSVEVKAGKAAELKGLAPQLQVPVYLKLPEKRRKEFERQGLVIMAEQWSKASKPSVTVRL